MGNDVVWCLTNKHVSQQLAYLGSDVILRQTLCFGLHAVIYFSRRPTVHIHNCRGLSAKLEDSIVLPLTCLTVCALPFNTIGNALVTKTVCRQRVSSVAPLLHCLDRQFLKHNPKEPMEWVLISFFYHNYDFI
jgi:hypothetical protein